MKLYEKVFWKYAANLQENTHAEVWFSYVVLLYICCIFSEHLFKRTSLEGCFSNITVTWKDNVINRMNMQRFLCPTGNLTKLTFPVHFYLYQIFSDVCSSSSSIEYQLYILWHYEVIFIKKSKPIDMKYSASYFSIYSILLRFWIKSNTMRRRILDSLKYFNYFSEETSYQRC